MMVHFCQVFTPLNHLNQHQQQRQTKQQWLKSYVFSGRTSRKLSKLHLEISKKTPTSQMSLCSVKMGIR